MVADDSRGDTSGLRGIVGPRVPSQERAKNRLRYLLPTGFMLGAGILLVVSMLFPYWRLTLHAPQYPKGLSVTVFVNRSAGDVKEIDGLNHYIGMRPLDEAAKIEKAISKVAITLIAVLVVAGSFIHTRWVVLLALPGLLFPAIFLGDLGWWLWNFGTHLDPTAPLSSSIKPFVPPVLGWGKVGQFKTFAQPELGLWIAGVASLSILAGLYFHRQAYKPLLEESKA